MIRFQSTYRYASVLLGIVCPALAVAAEGPQRVKLTTADGVEIVARYEVGPKGRKSPTVLILNGIGENRRPAVCDAIAAELKRQGCATLCFDFRGFGASTIVNEQFWDDATNRKLVRGYRANAASERITFADFKPGYSRRMVNDVAAARAFLDRRNDASECNSGHLLVLGLREGASIGAMWVTTEWSRYRETGGFNARLAANPEGRDILGCIWIDPVTAYDRQHVPLLECIKRASNKHTTFVATLHATDNDSLIKLSRQCSEALNKKTSRVFVSKPMERGQNTSIVDNGSLVSVGKRLIFDFVLGLDAGAR